MPAVTIDCPSMQKARIEYSVVVPLMNEEENVELLHDRIVDAFEAMGKPYEIIFVDDGSTDKTVNILEKIRLRDKNLNVIKFRKNFGQSAAMGAGFRFSRGEIIIAMDGDLQNDPADIPKLVAKLDDGFDVVSGWRKNRKDKMIIRKLPSRIANRLIQFLTRVEIHDTGCSLKAYRKEIIKKVRVYGELHRFIPALARIEGAKVGEVVVTHHPRKFGKSKYKITRTFKVVMDLTTLNLLMKYLSSPMRFFGLLGITFHFFGILALFSILYCVSILGYTLEDINVLLSTAFILLAGGFQSFFFGLLAQIVVRTGDRTRI
ncbi:MAG: glycosyltransferase family 2 protein [bacterium]